MNKVYYITYNDAYNGIYQSQVIDVVNYLNKSFDVKVELIAFVPLRLWKSQKRIIKERLPLARVYPILGSLDKLDRTSFLFNFILGRKIAICRGPLAFYISRNKFGKLVYDGRAAVEAEVKEYDVTGNEKLDQLFINAENIAINGADYFIAVSNKLVEYWEEKLKKKISKSNYSVIPCTLTSEDNKLEDVIITRNVKVVYSGGTGPWQSFEKVIELLDNLLSRQSDVEVLFLTKQNLFVDRLIRKYPTRCSRKWLNHNKVLDELSSCDYGILLRDDKITNRVASPVKFAEYLNAGLKVLISPNIGDFSSFLIENDCGFIVTERIPHLSKVGKVDKLRLAKTCKDFLFKDSESVNYEYLKLMSFI